MAPVNYDGMHAQRGVQALLWREVAGIDADAGMLAGLQRRCCQSCCRKYDWWQVSSQG